MSQAVTFFLAPHLASISDKSMLMCNPKISGANLNRLGPWPLIAAIVMTPPLNMAQHLDIPRLQTGTLLVESADPKGYLLASAKKTQVVEKDEVGFWPAPSISADGSTLVAARRAPGDISFGPRLIMGVYSVKDAKWTEYPEFEGLKAIAISPDGSKLACVTRDGENEFPDPPRFRFRVLDLKSGEVTVIRDSSDFPTRPSWSPDGHRIVFEAAIGVPYSSLRAIYLADLQNRTISRIGPGQSPSWSPSGEWIAYVGYIDMGRYLGFNPLASFVYAGERYSASRFQIRVMSTVGTRSRLLMRNVNQDAAQPVWSPDSKTLLITTTRDLENGTFDIHKLDLTTGKHRRQFMNVLPVFAWINSVQ